MHTQVQLAVDVPLVSASNDCGANALAPAGATQQSGGLVNTNVTIQVNVQVQIVVAVPHAEMTNNCHANEQGVASTARSDLVAVDIRDLALRMPVAVTLPLATAADVCGAECRRH